jgi:hypothetical protein
MLSAQLFCSPLSHERARASASAAAAAAIKVDCQPTGGPPLNGFGQPPPPPGPQPPAGEASYIISFAFSFAGPCSGLDTGQLAGYLSRLAKSQLAAQDAVAAYATCSPAAATAPGPGSSAIAFVSEPSLGAIIGGAGWGAGATGSAASAASSSANATAKPATGSVGTFIKRLGRKRAASGAALQHSVVKAEIKVDSAAGPAELVPGPAAAGSGAARGFSAEGALQAPLPPRAPIVLVRRLQPPRPHITARAAPGRPSLASAIGGFPRAAPLSPPPPSPAAGAGAPPTSPSPDPGSRQQLLQQLLAVLSSRCMAQLASAAGLRGVQEALSAAGQQLGPCAVQQALPPSPPAQAIASPPQGAPPVSYAGEHAANVLATPPPA